MPTLTAPDGTLLVYDMYEPATPRAAVLVLHGWSDHAGRWRDVGERLCAAGYSSYVLDLRGHGRSGGRRGYLSRFSQLLGDLQAFRRVVRLRTDRPQLLLGTSFGGLVALRYLETQPSDAIAGAVVVSPWLGLAFRPPAWQRLIGRVFADLWPTLPLPARLDADTLSRDPAVNEAYAADPAVHGVMTPGAWREIQWAQRAVPADSHRIETPLLFLLAGEDRVVDAYLARAFADSLKGAVLVRWYAEMHHEVLHDPQRDTAFGDVLAFFADLVQRLVDALDDLARFAHVDPAQTDAKTIHDGVAIVERKVWKALEGAGVSRVDQVGVPFDPHVHEAVTTQSADHPARDHTVGAVLQPGYRMGETLLRPARVTLLQWQGEAARGGGGGAEQA